MIAVIAALTPTSLASDKFREHRNEEGNFIAWCESNSPGAFRRFQVRYSGTDDPPETSSGIEEEHHRDFTVTVAYPATARYGAQQSLDRDDVIDQDRKKIKQAIGMHGRPNFTPPTYPDATWLADGEGTERVDGEACEYLMVVVRLAFIESLT